MPYIRFDWALKKILRNKSNFDVLEGFYFQRMAFGASRLVSECHKKFYGSFPSC